jgi:hypothetical protein
VRFLSFKSAILFSFKNNVKQNIKVGLMGKILGFLSRQLAKKQADFLLVDCTHMHINMKTMMPKTVFQA